MSRSACCSRSGSPSPASAMSRFTGRGGVAVPRCPDATRQEPGGPLSGSASEELRERPGAGAARDRRDQGQDQRQAVAADGPAGACAGSDRKFRRLVAQERSKYRQRQAIARSAGLRSGRRVSVWSSTAPRPERLLRGRLRAAGQHRQPAAVPVHRCRLRTRQPRHRQPLAVQVLRPLPARSQHRRQPARPAPAPQQRRRHRRRATACARPAAGQEAALKPLTHHATWGLRWPPAGTATRPLTGEGTTSVRRLARWHETRLSRYRDARIDGCIEGLDWKFASRLSTVTAIDPKARRRGSSPALLGWQRAHRRH